MLKFRSERVVPPGNKYFFEFNEVALESYTLSGLVQQVHKLAREKGIDAPVDVKAAVVDFMCRRLPEDFCYGDLEERSRARVVTMQDIKKATMAKAAGSERVLPNVADKRAVACSRCKCNDRSLCPTCIGLVAWASRLVGRKVGVKTEWIGICTVDATALPAMVHLEDNNPEGDFPEGCWRIKND